MKKLIVLFLLTCLLGGTLGACGNSESNSEKKEANLDNSGSDAVAAAKQEETEAEDDAEIVHIRMAFYCLQQPTDGELKNVQAAINEIATSQADVEVELIPLSMGVWDQQINLMISAGEQLDLMPTFFSGTTSFASMRSQNQLLPLNELLDQYGPDIKSVLRSEYLETTTFDGNIYAIPICRDIVSGIRYAMRTDILEDLGLLEKAQKLSSMQELEEILKVVQERTDLIPLAPSGAGGVLNFSNALLTEKFEDAVTYNPLINNYAVTLSTDPYKVVNLYETEEYKASIKLLEDWFNKGYIHPDAATTDESNEMYIANNKCFSYFSAGENATADLANSATGYDMTQVVLVSLPVDTSSVNTLNWTLPVTCKEPEAAMRFLNLMYSNKEIVDLLNYGIKDVDYQVLDNGTYGFLDGVNNSNVGYSVNLTWLFGNQYLAGCWDGFSPDTRAVSKEINDNAELSPLLGFSADTTGLDTQLTGLTSAYSEFSRGLNCGVFDVDTVLPEYIRKLKAAGVDEVVNEAQNQLNEWLDKK